MKTCGVLVAALLALPAIAKETVTAPFINAQGRKIGSVTLTQTESGVLVEAEASGLPPGERGFHFHEKGACDPKTGFESAGNHYSVEDSKHGVHSSGGPHAGDMPNQFVGADGKLRVHVFKTDLKLTPGKVSLRDSDGSALILHANADDYRSQPSGNAGDRIACAEIR